MNNTEVKISEVHKDLLRFILNNKYVYKHITMGDKVVGSIEIHDDGSVRFYTKRRRFKWLCLWFSDYKDISFRDLALTIMDVISVPNGNYSNPVFDGMTKDFMDKAVRNNNYEYVIDMLFDVLRYGGNMDGEYTSQYINMSSSRLTRKNEGLETIAFSQKRASVILNSGEVIGDVEILVRKP